MPTDALSAKPSLLRCLAGERLDPPPIWLLRQAGRYLPEYRELRAKASNFLEFCYTPELTIEATLQPIRRFELDAAILFSDILVIPDALGCQVSFVEGEGPRLVPIRDEAAFERLTADLLHQHLAPVYETVSGLKQALPETVPLIGFAGSPWTLACYMVDGGGSKDFAETRQMAFAAPDLFSRLIDLLSDAVAAYLERQVEAGADALMLFDSWAGILDELSFEAFSIRPHAKIVRRLAEAAPGIPVICFPRGGGVRLSAFTDRVAPAGLALDPSVPLTWARDNLAHVPCLQGNLDPARLVAGGRALDDGVDRLLEVFAGRPHIVNLGHGVVPQTPPAHVAQLVNRVRRQGSVS
ncbi:MAG: uroporphyrinogen decarboxylase [Geminicoccaceae bacterium]